MVWRTGKGSVTSCSAPERICRIRVRLCQRKGGLPGAGHSGEGQAGTRISRDGGPRRGVQTLYDDDDVVPPRPVQLVWKNWPRGLSTRS